MGEYDFDVVSDISERPQPPVPPKAEGDAKARAARPDAPATGQDGGAAS